MRASLSLFLLLLASGTPAFGQTAAAKLDPLLKIVASAERPVGAKAASPVPSPIQVLIKGDPVALRPLIAAAGGHVATVVGRICTARLPLSAIGRLAAHPAVERIELEPPLRPVNDAVAQHVGADQVRAGAPPLDRAYTGRGVVVGIVDTGIDFRHLDFRDPVDSTRSRILSLWDQADPTGPPPAGYTYGTEWTRAKIESALRGELFIGHSDSLGHGTHVSGTAAGNGAATGHYQGMAPQADLIVVRPWEDDGLAKIPAFEAFGSVDFFASSVVDAANYIYTLAASSNQPAVVNMSLGIDLGPHDGTSLLELALDGLLETPGRALCVAAGNEGGAFQHWGGFDLEADSLWTYFYTDLDKLLEVWLDKLVDGENYTEGLPLDIVLYGTISTNPPGAPASLAIGFDGITVSGFAFRPLDYEGQTPWHSLADLADLGTSVRDTLYYGSGEQAGVIDFAAQELEGGKVGFVIFVRDTDQHMDWSTFTMTGSELYRFMARGSGEIHLWAEIGWSGARPEMQLEITDDRYRSTDRNHSVSIPGTARGVITVGAYSNLPGGILPGEEGLPAGSLASFSSIGPTIDGRLKPEITAPGQQVFSTLSTDAGRLLDIYDLLGGRELFLSPEGQHVMLSGTSMATPVVAGAVALYLERYPTATNEQIREALFSQARSDVFTDEGDFGPLPNHSWGHGKLDIFAALVGGTLTAVTDAGGSVPAAVLLYPNHPNPFNPRTVIPFDLPAGSKVELVLYNLAGQPIRTLVNSPRSAGSHTAVWDGTDDSGRSVASGVYFYRLQTGQQVLTRKLLLVR